MIDLEQPFAEGHVIVESWAYGRTAGVTVMAQAERAARDKAFREVMELIEVNDWGKCGNYY